MRAVYPDLTESSFRATTTGDLLARADLPKLGSVHLSATDRSEFRKILLRYIDCGVSNKQHATRAPELWPLVRVIRADFPAPILKDVVLIDMPGIQDSSAGRSGKADSWTKYCHAQFICTSSTRAITDRSATDLLQEQQLRQIRMGGGANSDYLAFVATQKDNLTIDEMVENAIQGSDTKLSKQFTDLQDSFNRASEAVSRAEVDLKTIDKELKKIRTEIKALETSIQLVEDAEIRLQEGEQIFASEFTKKRKTPKQQASETTELPLTVLELE
jgi:hypothetical protein